MEERLLNAVDIHVGAFGYTTAENRIGQSSSKRSFHLHIEIVRKLSTSSYYTSIDYTGNRVKRGVLSEEIDNLMFFKYNVYIRSSRVHFVYVLGSRCIRIRSTKYLYLIIIEGVKRISVVGMALHGTRKFSGL